MFYGRREKSQTSLKEMSSAHRIAVDEVGRARGLDSERAANKPDGSLLTIVYQSEADMTTE